MTASPLLRGARDQPRFIRRKVPVGLSALLGLLGLENGVRLA